MREASLSAEILGRITLLQSMAILLPETSSMMDFICKGLQDLSGVSGVRYSFERPETISATEEYPLAIQHQNQFFSTIYFKIFDNNAFSPYIPFLENFATMIGVILDNRKQKEHNQQLNRNLEKLVDERTRQLQEREENWRITLTSIGDGVIVTDPAGIITTINPVASEWLGWKESSALGKSVSEVFRVVDGDSEDVIENPVDKVLRTGKLVSQDNHRVYNSLNSQLFEITDSAAPIHTGKEMLGVILVFRDVSEERKLQDQLNQSQKMEAIGQLAGGVAHDFNNMLGGIIGAAELIEHYVQGNAPVIKYLEIIKKASERAAGLTHKLLTFGRENSFIAKEIDMHSIIEDAVSILERSIDKKITIVLALDAEESFIAGDASQLQNAIMNLGINSSHAMPDGGTLSIRTTSVYLDDDYCNASFFDLFPGNYLHVEIRDTGHGIPLEIQAKVFEPFFTTKKIGKGTGLGLAIVYGTVKSHQGAVSLYSEPKIGTVFHLYFPLCEQHGRHRFNPEIISTGKGTILLIDDEEMIRATLKGMLEKNGYTVFIAADGEEGVSLFKEKQQDIDLIILDMIMPKMNGRETYHLLREIKPDVKVIIASGFAKDDDMAELYNKGIIQFLNKPFKQQELIACLNRELSS